MYKKIFKNGIVSINPKRILLNNEQIENPTEEQLIQAGYTYIEDKIIEPTLDEIIQDKLKELEVSYDKFLDSGCDVVLSDGIAHHFQLNVKNQVELLGIQTMIMANKEQIPFHDTEGCKFFSLDDAITISQECENFVMYNQTYFNSLVNYVKAMTDKDTVNSIVYGAEIPEEYQSDVLKVLNQQEATS